MKIIFLFVLLSFSMAFVFITYLFNGNYYTSNIASALDANSTTNNIQVNQSDNTSNQNINQTIKIMNNYTINNAISTWIRY